MTRGARLSRGQYRAARSETSCPYLILSQILAHEAAPRVVHAARHQGGGADRVPGRLQARLGLLDARQPALHVLPLHDPGVRLRPVLLLSLPDRVSAAERAFPAWRGCRALLEGLLLDGTGIDPSAYSVAPAIKNGTAPHPNVPTFVVHGTIDDKVNIEQADDVVNAMKAKGLSVGTCLPSQSRLSGFVACLRSQS